MEEALANAVYHKSYELGAPIEVQIWHDKIEVLSLPGPVPPVNAVLLKNQRRIVARENRNRRIGDFLKELHLTEGRGTGFPTIYDAMENNGSPAPIFETDDQTYVLVTLPAHVLFQTSVQENDQVGNQANPLSISTLDDLMAFVNQATNQALAVLDKEVHGRVLDILEETVNWVKREDMFKHMELSNQTFNRKKFLDPLIDIGWIQLEYPDTLTHPNQRYKITETGRRLLNIINRAKL